MKCENTAVNIVRKGYLFTVWQLKQSRMSPCLTSTGNVCAGWLKYSATVHLSLKDYKSSTSIDFGLQILASRRIHKYGICKWGSTLLMFYLWHPSLFLQNSPGQLLWALQDSAHDVREPCLAPDILDRHILKSVHLALIWTYFLLPIRLFYNCLLFCLLHLAIRALGTGIIIFGFESKA